MTDTLARDVAGDAAATTTGASGERGWDARLALGFRRDAARTLLARRTHRGPLVVQKPLYPEGAAVCQCVVVHPPAGIVGGDRLALDVDVEAGAWAQLTTPGAAKWYRSGGATASQRLSMRVGDEAVLEWLPQGTIVYDGARARSDVRVELTRSAIFIGFDCVALGRRA